MSGSMAAVTVAGETRRQGLRPAPQYLMVTEHQAYGCRYGTSGHVAPAAFPAGVNAACGTIPG